MNYGILGRLWLELKVMSSRYYDSKVSRCKAKVAKKFVEVSALDATIESVMLITARVEKDGVGWFPPSLDAWLFVPRRGDWSRVLGGPGNVALRGKADPAKKPPLSDVLRNVTWVEHPDTNERVGFLSSGCMYIATVCVLSHIGGVRVTHRTT